MASNAEKLDILRNGRKEGSTTVTADPQDSGAARQALISWLRAERWPESRWPEFSIMIPGPMGSREVQF